jgi:predicted transcriptional regulator
MMRLVIKIDGAMDKDLKTVFYNPAKAERGMHTLYLKNCGELYEILSPKRLELLKHIISHQAEKKTIGELAAELKRKQEAVSRDVALLAKYSLIKKSKEKQMVYLQALYKSLDIQLASG